MILNLPSEPCPPIISSPQISSSPAKVPTLPILPCPQHKSVLYNCVFCEAIYPSKYSFVKHMLTCTPELTDYSSMECPKGECTYNEVSHGKCSCCLACQNIIIRELSSDKDNNPHPLIYSSGKA